MSGFSCAYAMGNPYERKILKMVLWFFRNMLISLTITVIIEIIIAMLWKLRLKSDFETVVLVNLLTNPLIVFCVLSIRFWTGNAPALGLVLGMEMIVWIVEGWIYRFKLIGLNRPYAFAISANIASYGIGCIINYFI